MTLITSTQVRSASLSTRVNKVNPDSGRLAQIICLILHLLKPLEPKQSVVQNQHKVWGKYCTVDCAQSICLWKCKVQIAKVMQNIQIQYPKYICLCSYLNPFSTSLPAFVSFYLMTTQRQNWTSPSLPSCVPLTPTNHSSIHRPSHRCHLDWSRLLDTEACR